MKRTTAPWMAALAMTLVLLWTPASLAQPQAQAKPQDQSKGPLTLEQAVEAALDYSPQIVSAREGLEGAHAGQNKAISQFLPTLSTSYSYVRLDEAKVSQFNGVTIPIADQDTYTWTTSISQPLFTGFRLLSNYRLAELGVDVAQVQLDAARLDVVLSVKGAYFNLLAAQKQLDVARQAVALLQSQLKTTRDFHEVGILPVNDVLKVEVELASAQQQEVMAESEVALAISRLNTLLGRPVSQPLEVVDILGHHQVSLTLADSITKAKILRPELKAMELKLQQSDQAIRAARSGYYPELGVQGSYIEAGTKPELGGGGATDPTSWQVVASANWTFWEWGRTFHEVSQQQAAKRSLAAQAKDLEDQVVLQVQQAYLYLRNSEKTILTAQASVKAAKENYRITNERFKEQLTTNTELLDAQTLLTRAQTEYFTSLTAFNLAEARLLRAMGQGLPPAKKATP